MKKLAMVLAVAFTMGLATSAVTASTVNDDAKKKECCSKAGDKKDCSAKEVKACTEKKADKK